MPTASSTIMRPGAPASPVYSSIPAQPTPTYSSSPVRYAAGAVSAPRTVLSGQPTTTYIQAGSVQRPNITAGPAYTQKAYEEKHHEDAQLTNLKEIRQTGGLKNVPVADGLNGLKAFAADGKLTREQFLQAYAALLQQQGVDLPEVSVQNAVFDLFDRDGNNVVDMMEIICGISLLCAGSEDDKIHAVFNIFDENGDGFISMDEMFKFLTSVFKVVLTPHVMDVMNNMGVTVESAEDLASVTALECFKTADLNNDGKLSVVEFKNWFYAPRNDPSFLFSPVRKLLS
jgi:Ca2+-binding EF-hand superfamily protein